MASDKLVHANTSLPRRGWADFGLPWCGLMVLVLAVLAVYWNHFDNPFHFDDSHTIRDNLAIRSLDNIPRFFVDGTTFSVLPSNQSYRPVVSASLAIDYWIAGGLTPFYFHLSTFIVYLVFILIVFAVLADVYRRAGGGSSSMAVAFFATCWYALHPVAAETVNYVIQRGELYSALGLVSALGCYIYFPATRRFALYLLPVVVGVLAKPPAIMFAAVLFFYVLLFEEGADLCIFKRGYQWRAVASTLRRIWPTFVGVAALYLWQHYLTPATFTPGGSSLYRYLITQPFVHFNYVLTLFWPTGLSVDTDWTPLESILDWRAVVGIVFYLGLAVVALLASRRPTLRPISFGIIWFVATLLPTTVVPLAEVMNNHRMFLPQVGLILAIVWSLYRGWQASSKCLSARSRRIIELLTAMTVVVGIPALALATVERNEVWGSEESLWLDTATKSPGNGRALMNYGLTQMSSGNFERAREYFKRAEKLTPSYPILQINLGIVEGQLGNAAIAEAHFRRALALGPNIASAHYFFARWLIGVGRALEANPLLERAIEISPGDFQPRYLYAQNLISQRDWVKFKKVAHDMLAVAPADQRALELNALGTLAEQQDLAAVAIEGGRVKTADGFVGRSLMLYRLGMYEQSIDAAKQALQIDPNSVAANINVGAAYAALGNWEMAIQFAEKALALDPKSDLAKNNLEWARVQLKKGKE